MRTAAACAQGGVVCGHVHESRNNKGRVQALDASMGMGALGVGTRERGAHHRPAGQCRHDHLLHTRERDERDEQPCLDTLHAISLVARRVPTCSAASAGSPSRVRRSAATARIPAVASAGSCIAPSTPAAGSSGASSRSSVPCSTAAGPVTASAAAPQGKAGFLAPKQCLSSDRRGPRRARQAARPTPRPARHAQKNL